MKTKIRPLPEEQFDQDLNCLTFSLHLLEAFLNIKETLLKKISELLRLSENLRLDVQTKRPNLRLFFQNGAKGIANSEDP